MRAVDSRRGFVLIAALAAVIIGALWATTAADRIERAVEGGIAFDAESLARIKAQDAIAAATFLLTTSPVSVCGLQPAATFVENEFLNPETDYDSPCLKLDDRPQRIANVDVRLQDEGGLLSARLPNREVLEPFLQQAGATSPTLDLADTLVDFGDLNDDPLRQGGERRAYLDAKKRPPPNLWPRTPYEIFDALGWEGQSRPEIADRFGIALQPAINVNTANREILTGVDGFLPENVEAILAARERFGLESSSAVAEVTERRLPTNPFLLSFLPSPTTRVRIFPDAKGPMIEASITYLPASEERLWSLDYVLTAPHRPAHEGREPSGAGVSPGGTDRYGEWIGP